MNYSIFILFVAFFCASALGSEMLIRSETRIPRCFHFTWIVDAEVEENKLNCSDPLKKNFPCIEEPIVSLSPPNFTEIWLNKSNPENAKSLPNYTCILKGVESCIKYTYKFNDAIINSTFFCAKAVEDTVTPITNGCYSQMTEGHIIEVCVCRSTGLGMPCNSSTKNVQSFIVISLLIYCIYIFT